MIPGAENSYYRARYYDPATGRFLNEDPMRFAAGDPSFYAYVGNRAVNDSDPTGLSPRSRDRWYGRNDRRFQNWFHNCWKEKGDPDASKKDIEEAYQEWLARGKPSGFNGDCGSRPKPCQETQPQHSVLDDLEDWANHHKMEVAVGAATIVGVGVVIFFPPAAPVLAVVF